MNFFKRMMKKRILYNFFIFIKNQTSFPFFGSALNVLIVIRKIFYILLYPFLFLLDLKLKLRLPTTIYNLIKSFKINVSQKDVNIRDKIM